MLLWKASCLTVVIALVTVLIPTGPTSAESYGGVEFPGGARSFVDAVERPLPGHSVPPDVHPSHYSGLSVIGPPDFSSSTNSGYLSLGQGGIAIATFVDNALRGSDDASPDLHIFEVGADVESAFVSVSTNGTTWKSVGSFSSGNLGIDIDAYGFTSASRIGWVQVRDNPNQGGGALPSGGADIDAIGAISSVCLVDAPTLSSTATDVSVTLRWDDPSDGTSDFILQRQRADFSGWQSLRRLPSGTMSFTDTGRQPSRDYIYRIRVQDNDACESPWGEAVTARTAPARPTNLRSNDVGPFWVGLLWDDVASDETHFALERSINGGPFAPISGLGPISANETATVDGTVDDCTMYRYRLSAVRGSTVSRPSASVKVHSDAMMPDNPYFGRVTSRSVGIGWEDDSPNNDAYRVQRLVNGVWTDVGMFAGDASWFTDYDGRAGLAMAEGRLYRYRIRSECGPRDTDGNHSIQSNWATINVTTLLAAPGEPAQSFDEDNEPVVTWIDYSSRETGFVVEYEVDYDKWVQLGPTVPASSGTGKTVKLSLAGLNLYGEYVVRVRAIGLNGRYSEFAYTLGKF